MTTGKGKRGKAKRPTKAKVPEQMLLLPESMDAEAAPVPGDDDGAKPPSPSNGDGGGAAAQETPPSSNGGGSLHRMMSDYFLEYASYVIKDRAIPHLDDGLKPVQRRILHTLFRMDDGRFHKVANVVGDTMKYHPHGDASIYEALVKVANKEYFIDKQGNFGNPYTGDRASAARYVECRVSPLALKVLFNPEITEFTESYDGRNREPVTLPAKVPVLLMQGADGIAVGMATHILPHNFAELLQAQIDILEKKPVKLLPDFLHGGMMDSSEYEDGNGKIRLRAKIEVTNKKKTLVIREIPANTTTEALIASIEDASNKGKLKVATINDYTAEKVEIEIHLPRNVYADKTIQALYAYTLCQQSISVNCLVIKDQRPVIMTVTSMLEHNTKRLVEILRAEQELLLSKLKGQFHYKSLVQIFIQHKIYKRIETCETWEKVMAEVHKGLKPHTKTLKSDVTDDDVEKLLQIPIRRISKFDLDRNKDELKDITDGIKEVNRDLKRIKKYTIAYLKQLLKEYGGRFPRLTQTESIEHVNIRDIALSNVRIGYNRSGGYVGKSVRENAFTCTEFDRIVIIGWDGSLKVVPMTDKLYVGSVCDVFKADKEQVYSMIYRDKKTRICFAKRFKINRYIMDKEYKGVPAGCKVERLYDRQGIIMRCEFEPAKRQRTNHCQIDFDDIPIRSATAKGFKIAPKQILKFLMIKRGSGWEAEVEREDS